MATLERVSPDGRRYVADMADQFDRVCSVADGEKDYLQGVIDFYQTALTLRATLATQAQNEEVGQLTQASYTQNEEIKKISAWAAILFCSDPGSTIYGMNFEHMPELNWVLGYPAALILMLLTLGCALHRVEAPRLAVNRDVWKARLSDQRGGAGDLSALMDSCGSTFRNGVTKRKHCSRTSPNPIRWRSLAPTAGWRRGSSPAGATGVRLC